MKHTAAETEAVHYRHPVHGGAATCEYSVKLSLVCGAVEYGTLTDLVVCTIWHHHQLAGSNSGLGRMHNMPRPSRAEQSLTC
jgi:hypothetical protein